MQLERARQLWHKYRQLLLQDPGNEKLQQREAVLYDRLCQLRYERVRQLDEFEERIEKETRAKIKQMLS